MKKLIATSVLASSILFPALASAENLSFPVTMTVEKKVEIRKGATTAYPIVKSLDSGQQVKITGEFTNSTGQKWYHVDLGKTQGWGISTLFSNSTDVHYGIVNGSSVNVRKGATTSYQSIGTLSNGAKVQVKDQFQNSQGELWYRIESGSLVGWVLAEFINTDIPVEASDTQPPEQALETLKVGTKSAILYSGATFTYRVVEKIPYNSKVTVLDEFVNAKNQTWVRIKTSTGKTGWTPRFELIQSANDLTYVYALNSAVIRKGASTNYAVSVSLKENDRLTILQEVNGWLNVETSTGKRGWILKTDTSSISLKRLVTPTTYVDGVDNYLVWQKPINFKFSYTATSNQLKISQGITDVELPTFQVPGIQSIDTVQTSATEKSIILTFQPGYTFTMRNYSDKVSIKVLPTGMLGKKIVIDAGHGGKDTGAIGPKGLREKDANLGTALLVKAELENAGAIVTLTRSTDIFLELSERTDIANLSNADAFISIHSDSFSATSTGTTTYYNTSVNFNGPRSRQLGEAIQKKLYTSLNTYNRGVKQQDFYVNRMNELPSVLVELAYISNPNEEALLRSTDFRQKAATGIRQGLEDYFNNF